MAEIVCVFYPDPIDGRPIRDEYLIVQGGGLAGTGAESYVTAA